MKLILDGEPHLDTAEAAGRLGMTEGGLRWWRHAGRGPDWLKIGRKAWYPEGKIRDFLAEALAEGQRAKADAKAQSERIAS
jgi:hypothetical protein